MAAGGNIVAADERSAVGEFFETIRAIHLTQKRVILANLNELVAGLLEVFGMTKHAILMRKKAV